MVPFFRYGGCFTLYGLSTLAKVSRSDCTPWSNFPCSLCLFKCYRSLFSFSLHFVLLRHWFMAPCYRVSACFTFHCLSTLAKVNRGEGGPSLTSFVLGTGISLSTPPPQLRSAAILNDKTVIEIQSGERLLSVAGVCLEAFPYYLIIFGWIYCFD